MIKKESFFKKWHILIQILPFLVLIVLIKLIMHYSNLEIISLSALFTSMIAATIFLIGFLITGVISDYKESEKLPGELACSLESLYDDAEIITKNKNEKEAKDFLKFHREFISSLKDWLFQKNSTNSLLLKLRKMNDYFAKLESFAPASTVARMKQEQNNIRKIVVRMDTIRETSFVETAYAIVETLAFFLIVGLLILKMEPFYEALFFMLIVSFLVLYMVFLIKDLDNPFDYATVGENSSEISLKPLHDLEERLYGTIKKK